MDYLAEAKSLLSKCKFLDAGRIIDGMLSTQPENDELWYLRGIVAMKIRAYDSAQEYFSRALFIKEKPEYYRMSGLASFEVFELEDAIEAFQDALELDETDHTSMFFLAMSLMLMDDPRCSKALQKARKIDAKKTQQLLQNYYALFIRNDRRATPSQKSLIERKLKGV